MRDADALEGIFGAELDIRNAYCQLRMVFMNNSNGGVDYVDSEAR